MIGLEPISQNIIEIKKDSEGNFILSMKDINRY